MTDQVFTNARIVLEDELIRGTGLVSDGHIAAIDHGATTAAGALDLGGDMLIPGLIELHTDNLERRIEPRPGVGWPHAAGIRAHEAELASTGITTVFDALRVGSIHSGGKGDYGKCARKVASEIMGLRDAGAHRARPARRSRARWPGRKTPSDLPFLRCVIGKKSVETVTRLSAGPRAKVVRSACDPPAKASRLLSRSRPRGAAGPVGCGHLRGI